MFTLDTSLRAVLPGDTWDILNSQKHHFGVSRVTNTTHLDRVGIPVFAAIRPGAQDGSLCVSSGKAIRESDARLGALCEAIELAAAEFNSDRDYIEQGTIASFEKQIGLDIYDFCVKAPFVKKISSAQSINLTKVVEYYSGLEYLLPASLVFLPYCDDFGFSIFGQSSNGLSGGNTLEEALLHAIFEIVERDSLSFSRVKRNERLVQNINNRRYAELKEKVENAGLKLFVTVSENIFDLPMFISYIFENSPLSGVSIARGQGLHIDKDIALIRSVTEAVQSRLTNIHGGRDDIARRFTYYQKIGMKTLSDKAKNLRTSISSLPAVGYEDIFSFPVLQGIYQNLQFVLERLQKLGFGKVFYYNLAPGLKQYAVIKVIIPSMEFFDPYRMPRVGKRILKYARENF